MAAATAPAGAPVPGWPTSMRMMCGSCAARLAWRVLAAAITSITMNGGAAAARPILSAISRCRPSLATDRQPGAARVGGPAAQALAARQIAAAGDDVGAAGVRHRDGHRLIGAQRVHHRGGG